MKLIMKFFATATLTLFAASVWADSGLYIGGKTGVLSPDASGYNADDDNPLALHIGYSFGPFSLQAEAYSSESEVNNSGSDAKLDVVGLYGVFRTDGFLYFMAKGGLVDGEIKYSGLSQDDTSVSYGLGLGLNFADFIFVEAEYLLFDVEDTDFDFVGVSANIKF